MGGLWFKVEGDVAFWLGLVKAFKGLLFGMWTVAARFARRRSASVLVAWICVPRFHSLLSVSA